MEVKDMICKEGRCDIVWQTCRVHVCSCRKKKRHFEKIWYRRRILEFGGFKLEWTSETFGFSKPDNPNGEGSRYCKDNTGYLLGIRILGLVPGSIEEPGCCCAVLETCRTGISTQGAGAAQPLTDPLQHMLIAVQIWWLQIRCSFDTEFQKWGKGGWKIKSLFGRIIFAFDLRPVCKAENPIHLSLPSMRASFQVWSSSTGRFLFTSTGKQHVDPKSRAREGQGCLGMLCIA